MEADPQSLMWKLAEKLEDVTGRTAFDAMEQGDETAKNVVAQYIDYLACGLTSIVNIFQPGGPLRGRRCVQSGGTAPCACPGSL